jgi:cbb3-type cytochrome oxidase subunit 1
MAKVDALFLRVAVLYAVAGITLGIFMAISEDHSQMPTHAHINLLGWASMALYAVVYRLWPEAARSPLARWHFWLANLGAVALFIGVAGVMAGRASYDPLAAFGALVSLAGIILFAVIVFRNVPAREAAGGVPGGSLRSTP